MVGGVSMKYIAMDLKADNPFYTMLHPFDGFYDVRAKKAGKAYLSFIILILWCLVSIFERQSTGYIFNHNKISELNIFLQIAKVIIPFVMWVYGNWIISILMNGTGSFRDIWLVSAYSAVPYIMSVIISVCLSNILVMNEPFAQYAIVFGMLWSLLILFIGMMVIHEYTFSQNVTSVIFSVAVMGVILFLMMLLMTLWSQFYFFIRTIITEILFRI